MPGERIVMVMSVCLFERSTQVGCPLVNQSLVNRPFWLSNYTSHPKHSLGHPLLLLNLLQLVSWSPQLTMSWFSQVLGPNPSSCCLVVKPNNVRSVVWECRHFLASPPIAIVWVELPRYLCLHVHILLSRCDFVLVQCLLRCINFGYS